MDVEAVVRYSNRPRREIVRFAQELAPDLVVMGAHGHKGLKDLIFGTTINGVRHEIDAPIMIVRQRKWGQYQITPFCRERRVHRFRRTPVSPARQLRNWMAVSDVQSWVPGNPRWKPEYSGILVGAIPALRYQ